MGAYAAVCSTWIVPRVAITCILRQCVHNKDDHNEDDHKGFHFQFSERGRMFPPEEGGTSVEIRNFTRIRQKILR